MPEPTAAEKIARYTPPLPKQIRDATVDVDALINAQKNPPPAPPADPAAPPAPTPPADPAAPPAPAPPPPAGDPSAPPSQDLEHQLRSLQGRYENQVRINQDQATRLTEMERMIASMRSSGAQPEPPPPAPPARLITPEEEAEFGPELLDVAGRRAREVITPELSAYDLRLQKLENRVDGVASVTSQTAKERLYTDLTAAVPNWQAINRQAEFLQWLSFADPYSGRARKDMLVEAFTGQQANRVIQFFKGFLEATGTPPAPATPAPTPATPAPPVAPSLEQLAAPGRARSDPQPLPADKPTYTSAQYAALARDKLNGKWKGREAEYAAIEQDVFLAQKEGRFFP